MKKLISYILLFALCLNIFLFIITRGINLPYVGPYAFNYNVYSLIAHNYLQFGIFSVNFAPIISISEHLPSSPDYYLHHPPLISIAEAVLFKIFGESFWVGRLTVILFALGSGILLYGISVILKDKRFALIAFAVYSIIPASSIFGRMIGQEPLVLFFALYSLLLILLYIRSNNIFYIPFILIGVFLGVLSDWPMVYFVLSLAPYLIYKKKIRLLAAMVFIAFITALGFIVYIANLQSGLNELFYAFINRSQGWMITPYYLWPLLWPIAMLVRFLIYFNPIFAVFSLVYLVILLNGIVKRHLSSKLMLYASLFIFGITHVLLYPSGSFGHIYWIYYFIPFVCFASASILELYFKKKYLIIGIFLFSFIFLMGVNKWKLGEIKGNIWRFDLAQQANKYLPPYEAVLINKGSSLDVDVLRYKFLHDATIASPSQATRSDGYRRYLYSCDTICDTSEKDLEYLLNRFEYKKLKSSQGEGYVFLLDKPAEKIKLQKNNETNSSVFSQQVVFQRDGVFRQIYKLLVSILQVPFL